MSSLCLWLCDEYNVWSIVVKLCVRVVWLLSAALISPRQKNKPLWFIARGVVLCNTETLWGCLFLYCKRICFLVHFKLVPPPEVNWTETKYLLMLTGFFRFWPETAKSHPWVMLLKKTEGKGNIVIRTVPRFQACDFTVFISVFGTKFLASLQSTSITRDYITFQQKKLNSTSIKLNKETLISLNYVLYPNCWFHVNYHKTHQITHSGECLKRLRVRVGNGSPVVSSGGDYTVSRVSQLTN